MSGAVSHINSRAVQVIIGVDTHKDQHVAAAIDGRGVRLNEKHVPVATCGYEELERWSCNLWDGFTRSELRAQVPTVPDSHAS